MNNRSRRHQDRPLVTTRSMISPRLAEPALRVLSSLCAGTFVLLAAPSAFAQGKLDARYEATLAGIPVVNGGLVASSYSATTTTSKKSEAIRMVLSGGNVKEYVIEPEPPVEPERLPVTDAQRRGVYDPMTGSMLRVPGSGDPLSPDACRTGAAIFDGRMRYDLKLDFKRMETVKAEKGYHGPVVVCAIFFTPVAGYIPDRPVIKYLANERRIEIAFVPIAGTRILVPFRMTIPTPFGPAMLEATSFVTTAMPPRLRRRIDHQPSFRGDAKHRTRNLEIPGSLRAPE